MEAEAGSGLRETIDKLRQELEEARANAKGAVPSDTHGLTVNELRESQEKAAAAETAAAQARIQVTALEADKVKLGEEVEALKEQKQKATDNWKKFANKAEERKTKCQAAEKERDDLKRVVRLSALLSPLSHAFVDTQGVGVGGGQGRGRSAYLPWRWIPPGTGNARHYASRLKN